MTNDILRLILLALQLGFLALLVLIVLRFARSLRADLRQAAAIEAASRTGIGRLVVLESPGGEPAVDRVLHIGPITTLGRDVNSTIYLDDEFASGTHAVLTFRGRSWYAEDRGSTNGTWVNGHRIERPVALTFGDELTIGRVRFRLER
ncbi:MAG TPA: FHA domain-containing protein [Candidatus Limnocylindria bacterium]|nr:FHA domain-containing protein [Candidatus Limnocylindria bacterium]